MIFLSSMHSDALSTGDWRLHGVRVNESWDAVDNWNDADKNGDKRRQEDHEMCDRAFRLYNFVARLETEYTL